MSWKYDCAKTVKMRCPCETDDNDAKGAHVANALRVDAGIGISKIYAKRALREMQQVMRRPFKKHSNRSFV